MCGLTFRITARRTCPGLVAYDHQRVSNNPTARGSDSRPAVDGHGSLNGVVSILDSTVSGPRPFLLRASDGAEVRNMNATHIKTRQLLDTVGITYSHLHSLLRSGRINAPEKDVSGDYVWTKPQVDA